MCMMTVLPWRMAGTLNIILGAVNLASLLAVQATDYAAQLAAAFGALAQAAEQSASATLLLEVCSLYYAAFTTT